MIISHRKNANYFTNPEQYEEIYNLTIHEEERQAFNEIPPRVEYSLTKRGKELRIAIIPLLKWATKKGNFKMHCNCSLLKK